MKESVRDTKRKKSLPFKIIKIAGILLVVLFVGAYFLFDTRSWEEKNQYDRAYIMMQRFIEKGIDSPSTAVFPSEAKNQTKYLGNQEYEITSWVDSQNIFGAMIRTKYTGVVKQTEKDNWQLVAIDLKK